MGDSGGSSRGCKEQDQETDRSEGLGWGFTGL